MYSIFDDIIGIARFNLTYLFTYSGSPSGLSWRHLLSSVRWKV